MDSVFTPLNIAMETRNVLMAVMNSTVVSTELLATFLYLCTFFIRQKVTATESFSCDQFCLFFFHTCNVFTLLHSYVE